jgi:hypothetical protein
MSESKTPFNNHDQSEPASEAVWIDPFTGMDEGDDSDMNSLFSALAAEAVGADSVVSETTVSETTVSETTVSETTQNEFLDSPAAVPLKAVQSEPVQDEASAPELADLISLIQELNQCNSALLDRVSQLEDALEQSQGDTAIPALNQVAEEPMPQDLPKAQEQITTLYNQLEFAHQTNQRQQILLETLTHQLECSQERVAQLERDTSFLQQRYTEQNQAIAQAESNNHDLQARLHRQQRYTLQFKAALEKCLEVPIPQYEGQDAPAPSHFLLPKAQRIKPWAAQSDAAPMPWMNLTPGLLENFAAENAQGDSGELNATESLHLPAFNLPNLQVPPPATESSIASTADAIAPVSLNSSAQPDEALNDPALNDPALMAHISSVVQPLADLIAEAMMAEPFPVDALQPQPLEEQPLEKAGKSAISADPANAQSQAKTQPPVPMADAEDALWQDLARLIDVSTEDVVKASLSGDFAAFEAIDFAALEAKESAQTQSNLEPDPWDAIAQPAPVVKQDPVHPVVTQTPAQSAPAQTSGQPTVQPTVQPPIQPIAPASKKTIQPPPSSDPQTLVPAFATTSTSPSPLVYPLRPAKKRQSLAMVELPDFRKPHSNPLPT